MTVAPFLPPPRAVTREDLIGAEISEGSVNGLRVMFEGRAIGETENGFAVNVDDLPVNVMVDNPPAFVSDCGRTHPKVRVTGVAELMLDQSVLLGREGYVIGVKVEVSDASDIVLEPDLAYLQACHDRRIVVAVVAVSPASGFNASWTAGSGCSARYTDVPLMLWLGIAKWRIDCCFVVRYRSNDSNRHFPFLIAMGILFQTASRAIGRLIRWVLDGVRRQRHQ